MLEQTKIGIVLFLLGCLIFPTYLVQAQAGSATQNPDNDDHYGHIHGYGTLNDAGDPFVFGWIPVAPEEGVDNDATAVIDIMTDPKEGPQLKTVLNLNTDTEIGKGTLIIQNSSVSGNGTSIMYAGSVNNLLGADFVLNGNITATVSTIREHNALSYANYMFGVESDYKSSIVHNGNFTLDFDFYTYSPDGPRGIVASGTSNYTLNGNLDIKQMRAVGNNGSSNTRHNTLMPIGVLAYDYNTNFNPSISDGPSHATLGVNENNTISIKNVIAEMIDTKVQPNANVFPQGIRAESTNYGLNESTVTVNGTLLIDNVFGKIGAEDNLIVAAGNSFSAEVIGIHADYTSGVILNAPAVIKNIIAETYTISDNGYTNAVGLESLFDGYIIANGPLTISGVSAKALKGDAFASGVVAYGGTVDILSNLDINDISVEGEPGGDHWALALYAGGNGVININQLGDTTINNIKMEGNLNADGGGVINANLDNDESYLRGLLIEDGGVININFSRSATWAPTGDDYFYNVATAAFTNSVIDMAWWNLSKLEQAVINSETDFSPYFRTMGLESATINSGFSYVVNSDIDYLQADCFYLGELISRDDELAVGVQVAYDPIMETFTNSIDVLNAASKIPVFVFINANDKTITEEALKTTRDIGLSSYDIYPILTQDDEGNGDITIYLTGFRKEDAGDDDPSETVKADDDNIILMKWLLRSRLANDNWMRRVSDLRIDPEHNDNGVWVRMYMGEQEFDSSFENRSVEQYYYGGQLGIDKKYIGENSTRYLGLFLDALTTDNTYASGSGNMTNIGVGAYSSWVLDNGAYIDLVGKVGKLNGDYRITNLNNEIVEADFDALDMSASLEYGHRIKAQAKWIIEPQVQLTYGKIKGMDYVTSNDIAFSNGDIESLIGRAGFIVGREYKEGNVYFGGDFFHDFKNNVNVNAQYIDDEYTGKVNFSKEWYRLKVGGNTNISKDDTFYFEASSIFGKGILNSNWVLDCGLRFWF